MSRRILSPAVMPATDVTLMLDAPAGASTPARPACPACRLRSPWPPHILHRPRHVGKDGAVAEGNLLADREAVHAGDRHVGRAGGDRDHRTGREAAATASSVLPAAVPMRAIVRVSVPAPVSMVIVFADASCRWCSGRRWCCSPIFAGTASPEFEGAEQVQAPCRELRPLRGIVTDEKIGLLGLGAESGSSWQGRRRGCRRCEAR